VTTVTDETYTYDVTFEKTVPESTIDTIISGGIEDVNSAITSTAHTPNSYATLGSLGEDNSVTVTISNGDTQVTSVYTDIIETLLTALKQNAGTVASIKTSDSTVLKVSETVSAEQIEAFVKASGLKDNGNAVNGNTKLSALDKQTLQATVTTVTGEEYTYNVTFAVQQ
jgi:uncharacterized protein YajQ (UPF0234 family)